MIETGGTIVELIAETIKAGGPDPKDYEHSGEKWELLYLQAVAEFWRDRYRSVLS